VLPAARDRPPDFESGAPFREQARHPELFRQHVRHAVAAALGSLANIVQECRRDEVGVVMPMVYQPARCRSAMHNVPWVLSSEQLELGPAQAFARHCIVGLAWFTRRFAKLPQASPHHTPMRRNT
jgi:hypothetical protein